VLGILTFLGAVMLVGAVLPAGAERVHTIEFGSDIGLPSPIAEIPIPEFDSLVVDGLNIGLQTDEFFDSVAFDGERWKTPEMVTLSDSVSFGPDHADVLSLFNVAPVAFIYYQSDLEDGSLAPVPKGFTPIPGGLPLVTSPPPTEEDGNDFVTLFESTELVPEPNSCGLLVVSLGALVLSLRGRHPGGRRHSLMRLDSVK
jgi:hypothetical protein